MLSGTTLRASAMAGTAVFRIVVSNDSIKNATATSHGNNCLPDVCDEGAGVGSGMGGCSACSMPDFANTDVSEHGDRELVVQLQSDRPVLDRHVPKHPYSRSQA